MALPSTSGLHSSRDQPRRRLGGIDHGRRRRRPAWLGGAHGPHCSASRARGRGGGGMTHHDWVPERAIGVYTRRSATGLLIETYHDGYELNESGAFIWSMVGGGA